MNYQEYIKLCEDIKKYQDAYYLHSKPLISDFEFDNLYQKIIDYENENPDKSLPYSPSLKVGSDIDSKLEIKNHHYKILSLNKVDNNSAFISWVEKMAFKDKEFILEEKIDGLTLVLTYKDGVLQEALSRGDGLRGNDLLDNSRTIKSIPLKLSSAYNICIRGEVFIKKQDFLRLSKDTDYINPRNFASGILRRVKSSDVAKYPLMFFAYEVFFLDNILFDNDFDSLLFLKKEGFDVNFENIKKIVYQDNKQFLSEFEKYFEQINLKRDKKSYDIDGIVIKINNYTSREELGFTDHHPRWAVAYKFAAPKADSTILDIVIQVGRTGKITPVAMIKATFIGNSIVKKATLHNQDYIKSLNINIGDDVLILKKGDIIPAVCDVLKKNSTSFFCLPKKCPSCESLLLDIGANKFCKNRFCYQRILQRTEFFCSKNQMDIQSLGSKILEIFIKNQIITDIGDLYRLPFCQIENFIYNKIDYIILTKTKLLKKRYSKNKSLVNRYKLLKFNQKIIPNCDAFFGIGLKKLQNIKQSVQNSKDNSLEKKISSLGLSELGTKSVKMLFDKGFDLNMLLNLKKYKNKFLDIPGFGLRMFELLEIEFSKRSVIKDILDMMLYMDFEKKRQKESLIFEGQKWCLTGSFYFKSRDEIANLIQDNGGLIASSVSKNTNFLLCGTKPGSKLEKAKELGLKILKEDEFLSFLKQNKINL